MLWAGIIGGDREGCIGEDIACMGAVLMRGGCIAGAIGEVGKGKLADWDGIGDPPGKGCPLKGEIGENPMEGIMLFCTGGSAGCALGGTKPCWRGEKDTGCAEDTMGAFPIGRGMEADGGGCIEGLPWRKEGAAIRGGCRFIGRPPMEGIGCGPCKKVGVGPMPEACGYKADGKAGMGFCRKGIAVFSGIGI